MPPTGDWLITEPAGTVVLVAVVTVPTVRPAPVIADVAAALRQADDARHRDLRRTGRDDEDDGAAGGDLRAGRRATG